MRWVLEHLQVIIVVAGAIAYYLNQRRRAQQGLPPEDEDGSYDPASMEAEEAERTRRLQEELRRKREQREAGEVPMPAPAPAQPLSAPARREAAPPPVFQDPLAEMMKEISRRLAPQPSPQPVRIEPDQDLLEQQREMDRRLKALQAEAAAARERAEAIRLAHRDTSYDIAVAPAALREGLRNPAELRRAIVLNEILGKPLALR